MNNDEVTIVGQHEASSDPSMFSFWLIPVANKLQILVRTCKSTNHRVVTGKFRREARFIVNIPENEEAALSAVISRMRSRLQYLKRKRKHLTGEEPRDENGERLVPTFGVVCFLKEQWEQLPDESSDSCSCCSNKEGPSTASSDN